MRLLTVTRELATCDQCLKVYLFVCFLRDNTHTASEDVGGWSNPSENSAHVKVGSKSWRISITQMHLTGPKCMVPIFFNSWTHGHVMLEYVGIVVRYCWWKKSCTSWEVVYPTIFKVLYIPGGLQSTVWPTLFSGRFMARSLGSIHLTPCRSTYKII